MKLEDIDGLLLCSKCEEQLRVEAEGYFFKVYPCTRCARRQKETNIENLMGPFGKDYQNHGGTRD